MKRVLIKISGEVLPYGKESKTDELLLALCHNIKAVLEENIDVGIVIGGGNVIRGSDYDDKTWLSRETADSIGMLSTAMNSILLRECLVSLGLSVSIVSTIPLPFFDIETTDIYTVRRLLASGRTVLFACGVGVPYFSTDTMSVIASAMSGCSTILKATKTDGIYDKDPKQHTDAVFIPNITHTEAIQKNIKIMDTQAFSLAAQKNITIHVFSMYEKNCFIRAIRGDIRQSLVAER
jgi:uridylate kinase